MESLQGYFLISTPQMPDPRFQERVVYLCAHTEEGAMGLVVNQPIPDVQIADIMRSAEIPVPQSDLPPVYLGGPVGQNTAFVLYSSDYEAKNQLEVSKTVRLSSDVEILEDIARGTGPVHYVFALGYAGWAPGQLESELTVNGWLTLPGDDDILFRTANDHKWKKAAEKYGIDITVFGDVIGTA